MNDTDSICARKRFARLRGPGYLIRELSGGLVAGTLTVVYAFSYAAIMFSGPISHGFTAGLSMALITAVVTAVIVAALGSVSFAIAGPDIYSAVPLAVMLNSLASLLPDGGSQPQSLATLVVALALTTIATGTIFYVVGRLRCANIVRFVPYPVIAGFLSATGVLIAMAGIAIVTGKPMRLDTYASFTEREMLWKLAATFGFTLAVSLTVRRYQHAASLPVLIFLGVAGFYLALRGLGLDVGDAGRHGWLFDLDAGSYTWEPWFLQALSPVRWSACVAVVPEMLAVSLITMLAVLINTSSLEVLVDHECDLNQDLRAHGIASLASASLGGFVGSVSISRTSINRLGGGRGVLSSFSSHSTKRWTSASSECSATTGVGVG